MQSHLQAQPSSTTRPFALRGIATPLPRTSATRISRQPLCQQRGSHLVCSSSSASAPAPDGNPAEPSPQASTSPGLLGRVKRFFLGDKLDKEKLAQLGMGAFASYGLISNVTYGICLGIAWISFVKATGKSPLAAGQWPAFLAFYAGLWTMQNIVRPLRFSLAIALAPVFERVIMWISTKTGLPKRWAFALYLVGFAATTCIVLFGSIYLLGGFPPTSS